MNQNIQPLFEVDAMNVAAGNTPDPEVAALPKRPQLPKRRQFSAAYKRRLVREANACQVPGRWMRYCAGKGCTASHLTHWRREVEACS